MAEVAELEEGQALPEEELLEAGPLIETETRIVVPTKGKVFQEDGTCEVAVIRPCVSRGKRLRGLPPIYTPQMLAENAAVYTNWLMYADHLTEAIVELLQERGRSIRELGGRVVKSWWDAEFRRSDDDDRGYRPGAVRARVLPQPPIRAMLEADPEILHVSHNAWPTAARKGAAPWNPKLKGMLIEGIRSRPEGSVDWVPRGGAGGHVMVKEDVELAVSLLESYYDSADAMDWSSIKTLSDLQEALKEKAPAVAELLSEREKEEPGKTEPSGKEKEDGGLTEEDVKRIVTEAVKESVPEQLTEEQVEERVTERLAERDEARQLERYAHKLIEGSGLPRRWQADLKARYAVLPSGPTQYLLVEAEEDDDGKEVPERDVLKKRIEEDLQHCAGLIQESGGRVRVTGLGADKKDPGSTETKKAGPKPEWRGTLNLKVEEGEKEDDKLAEVLTEGVS